MSADFDINIYMEERSDGKYMVVEYDHKRWEKGPYATAEEVIEDADRVASEIKAALPYSERISN